MRFWTSIAEYKTDAGAIPSGSGSRPLSDRFGARVTRAIFRAVIRRCLFRFARTAICLFATRRLGLLRLSRCADDCRLPPLRFECLAKIIRLDLTKTFDLTPALDRQLIVAPAGGLRKLVELFLQVKDLFLQIYYVPGAQLW